MLAHCSLLLLSQDVRSEKLVCVVRPCGKLDSWSVEFGPVESWYVEFGPDRKKNTRSNLI